MAFTMALSINFFGDLFGVDLVVPALDIGLELDDHLALTSGTSSRSPLALFMSFALDEMSTLSPALGLAPPWALHLSTGLPCLLT